MSLENLYFIAEIIAALAVIASILYLAIQVKHSNAQNQASARFEFVRAMGEVNLSIAQDESLAEIVRKGINAFEEMSENEIMRFQMLVGQYTNVWSVMYGLYHDKLLPESEWFAVRKDIHSLLYQGGGRVLWRANLSKSFEPGFVQYVEALFEENFESYDITFSKNEPVAEQTAHE